MGFIDSYKHLEKLCGDLLHDDRKLSAYIDEMIRISSGARYVRNWDYDLKQLKHYRWIRNQIVHEPGCTEQNMCTQEDTYWLDNFYSRIMTQMDPLALYYKATMPKPKAASVPQSNARVANKAEYKVPSKKKAGNLLLWICILFVVTALIFVLKMYK